MADGKIEVLLSGPPKTTIVNGLAPFTVHRLADAKDRDALLKEIGPRVRAMAVSVSSDKIGPELMRKLPKLEIVSTFAVGYDHVLSVEHEDRKFEGTQELVERGFLVARNTLKPLLV